MDLKELVAAELEAARRRSLGLLEPVPEADLLAQHSPLMSPLVWDLAHVGNYEEIWLLRTVMGLNSQNPDLDDVYDAFKHARRERTRLQILGPEASRSYIGDIRGRAMDALERVDFDDLNPLLKHGFVYGLVIQHEQQHDETMLATLQLRRNPYPFAEATVPPAGPVVPAEVFVPGGRFVMGTDSDPWAYDNERPAHTVDVQAFWIDAAPVSNRDYLRFMTEGGYRDRRFWSEKGWAFRLGEQIEHPQFWIGDGAGWSRNRFGRRESLPLDEPVQHVCFYEAEAYSRWAGKRLPTEAEWEKAASWDPASGTKRRFPWGDDPPTPELANLGQRHFGPAPLGAYSRGVSASGCHQMIGDVWEWTSSDFTPHPGFVSFPYAEYSQVFFGRDYKVLRGGSWATDPVVIRNTFRNWDYPIRRQIFAGFRCARDA
jgi:gamma-glutamyl hercynylcysteine S-oxide synthase